MNCPHYVCLFEPLAEDGAYTLFWCSCGLAVRVGHPCPHYFAVLHYRSSSVGFHLGLFNPIFIFKQFQTATEILITAKCSNQRLLLPTVQVAVAIHATDDEIMLTDISSWADLPAKTKREQIVRSLGNLHSRMRQYIANVDRVATHLSRMQGPFSKRRRGYSTNLWTCEPPPQRSMWQVHKHHDLFPRLWPPSEPCSQLSGRLLSEGMVQRVLQREEVGVGVGVAVRR